MQAVLMGPAEWSARRAAHEARVRVWTDPHLARAGRREAHPVLDFLFTYYDHSPGALLRWHPGAGVILGGEAPHRDWTGYVSGPVGVSADLDLTGRRGRLVRDTAALLRATAARRPAFGCHGLHEWAMVYRSAQDEVRHSSWPLRLTPDALDAVVEAAPLRCTHFDAFRFFTEPARRRNALTLTRAAMPVLEQGGCLHTNMDLYRHAYRLGPLVGSELVVDSFALAAEIRTLDMRASPYDLSDLGYEPVRIESEEGRARYVSAQREFATRAATVRDRLIDILDTLAPE